jgi:hypothetical protein
MVPKFIKKRMPMNDAHSFSGRYIPDPDTRSLARSHRALFAAILSRALKDIFRPTYSDRHIYKTQALYWISVDDPDSITSFISICSYLDIDADKIRHKVFVELSRIECDLLHHIKFNLGNNKVRSQGPTGRSTRTIAGHSC